MRINKIVCDRCGKVIPEENLLKLRIVTREANRGICNYRTKKEYDICEECQDDIEEILIGGKDADKDM